MLRYGLRLFHITLAVTCIYLLYNVVSSFSGTRPPEEIQIAVIEELPPAQSAFAPYEIVGERNLFESRETALPEPLPAPPPEEELAQSALRLRLLGTIAGTRPDLSIATLEDETTREHLHVRVGDEIGDSADVTVARIERKKLVLNNRGQLEAITMDEPETTTRPKGRAAARKRSSTRPGRPRARSLGGPPPGSQRERLMKRVQSLKDQKRAASRKVSAPHASAVTENLLGQLRFAPSFKGGVKGVQVSEVLPGPLRKSGLRSGDVIVAVDGVGINGPKDLPKLFASGTAGKRSCLETVGPDGHRDTHCWDR